MERKDSTDLTGKRFGYLVVISLERVYPRKGGTIWNCKCDCGKQRSIPASALKSGNARSCGCMARHFTPSLEGIAVAKMIKPFRDNHKMSQRAAAILVGCSTNTISIWERGLDVPKSHMIRKIHNLVDSKIIDTQEEKQMSQEEILPQEESEITEMSTMDVLISFDYIGMNAIKKLFTEKVTELASVWSENIRLTKEMENLIQTKVISDERQAQIADAQNKENNARNAAVEKMKRFQKAKKEFEAAQEALIP